MSSRLFWSIALLLAGCPSALSTPDAVIASGSSAEVNDKQCEEPPLRLDVELGKPAPIHAACSHDANGGLSLHYKWAIVDQPNGSKIEIPNDEVISPTVVPDVPGRYRVGLVVSNGTLSSERTLITLDAQ